MDLELFKIISKYPFTFDGKHYDSVELSQNKSCIKCKEKDCLIFLDNKSNKAEYVCSKGYDNVVIVIDKIRYIINGVIYKTNKNISRERKIVRKDWVIHRDDLLLFIKKIEEIENHLIDRINEATEKNFSMFHDFKTSMNVFFKCTQDIINNLPGNTFEQKLTNSNKPHKDLFNALELITSQLGMIDVIINPKSISFGTKREINIYKLFDKITMLFEHLSDKKRNVTIKLTNVNGAYIENSLCYESIEFIPLILLDNAIKYSSPHSTIEIKIAQLLNKAKITVKSIGPFVTDGNENKIFEKFYRDESAIEFSKSGIGIGLWIAQRILETHISSLSYHKDPHATTKVGLNIFEFDLETL